MGKLLGKLYDGRWIVSGLKCYTGGKKPCEYVLTNIYNGQEIKIDGKTLRLIDREQTTVSKVISEKIKNGEIKVKPDNRRPKL